MAPIKELFDNETQIISFEQTIDFFENVQGSVDPLSTAKDYTSDILELLQLLTKIHSYTSDRQIKTKCTKTKKRIMKQLNLLKSREDAESDVSLTTSQESLTELT